MCLEGAVHDKNNTRASCANLERLARRLLTHPGQPVVFRQWTTNLTSVPAYQRSLTEVFYTVFINTLVTKGLIS